MRRMNSKSEKKRERERGVREGSGEGERPQHVRLVIIISATLGQWLKWCSRCRFNLHNEVVFIVAAPIGSALYLASRRQDYLCPTLSTSLPSPLTLSPFLCVCFVLSHLAQTPNKIERWRAIARPRPFPPLAPLPYLELLLLLLAVRVGSGWVGVPISIPDASFPSIGCIFNGSSSYRTHFNVAPFNGFVFGSHHHHHLWLSLWLWPQWKCYKYACDLVCAIWFGFPNTPKSWLKVKLLCHFWASSEDFSHIYGIERNCRACLYCRTYTSSNIYILKWTIYGKIMK